MFKGRARLAVSTGLSVWVLEAPQGFGDSSVHAHHAIQITACFRGELALVQRGRELSANLLAVAPDAPHKLEASGLLGFVFVEPESRIGRRLLDTLFPAENLVAIESAAFMREIAPLQSLLDAPIGSERMLDIGRAALKHLAEADTMAVPDQRIQRIIDYAAAHPDESLIDAAEAAGVHLSHSRLRHLFVEQTGLAFKTYMVWLRLVRAIELYSEGRSLTEAAHAAGFADSAHFSRVFKRTFGAPATTLKRL